MKPPRRKQERGFALLFAFAIAAAVAIMFYLELPRLTFEAQREKEELLVMRGEEYIRGTQLFVRKNQKYPQNLDELEKFNNLRFLRRRYRDPMTGTDEWRLIHIDPMGQLTDSLVHKPAGDKDKEKGSTSILASNIQGIGASAEVVQPDGTQAPSAALQRRASDRIIPTGQGVPDGSNPDGAQPANPAEGESRSGPGNVPGQGLPQFPAMAARGGAYPNQAVNPQQGGQLGMPVQPGQVGAFPQPGMQPQPVAPGQQAAGSGSGFGSSSGFGGGSSFGGTSFGSGGAAQPNTIPNQPPNFQPGARGGMIGGVPGGMVGNPGQQALQPGPQPGQPNPALQMIQNIISNPRPGGLQGTTAAGGVGGQQLGGGVAGVASKKDAQTIRVYNDRTNYKEWEFIYDRAKDQLTQAAKQGIPGQGQGQPPSPLNQPGSPFNQVPRQRQ